MGVFKEGAVELEKLAALFSECLWTRKGQHNSDSQQ